MLYTLYNKAMIRMQRRPSPRLTTWLLGKGPSTPDDDHKSREAAIWDEIRQTDEGLAMRIVEKARSYGYPGSTFPG